MLNPESILENEMYKFLWDFEIQTDHLNLSQMTRPSDSQPKKKKRKKKKKKRGNLPTLPFWLTTERKQKKRSVPRP